MDAEHDLGMTAVCHASARKHFGASARKHFGAALYLLEEAGAGWELRGGA